MTHSVGRAWTVGVGIVLAAYITWFIALRMNRFSEVMILLWWCSPAVAASVAAYLAPRWKIIVGASMAIPAAALSGILNFVYEALGNAVDFPGTRGGLILVAVTLVWNAVLCTLGAAAGYFVTRKSVMAGTKGQ